MRGAESALATLATADAGGGGWAGAWPAALDSPAGLLGVVALVVVAGAVAARRARSLGSGSGRPRTVAGPDGGRRPAVVVVDLDRFTDEELVRLLRLRRRLRARKRVSRGSPRPR